MSNRDGGRGGFYGRSDEGREPRGVLGRGVSNRYGPYNREIFTGPNVSSVVSRAADAYHRKLGGDVGVTGSTKADANDDVLTSGFYQQHTSASVGIRRVTAKSIDTLAKRKKVLPPDANSNATNCKLYQLEEHVLFHCAKCGKDGVKSDCLAVESDRNLLMCVRCFSKLVRPKQFKPTRLVPFPSLLSWLSYQPPTVMTSTPTDLSMRAADAVVPSGRRVATGTSEMTDIRALPSSGMVHSIGKDDAAGQKVLRERAELHPCIRLWGECFHGALCYYKDAPKPVAIEYLMGICTAEQAKTQGLIVEKAFDLPQTSDPIRAIVVESRDFSNKDSSIMQWLSRRKQSHNKAEWQLFNNGGNLEELIRQFVYVREVPVGPSETGGFEEDVAETAMDGNDLGDALDAL
eukprot:Tbor_TRINITY_DN5459_c0_g4::TRINITY_DN5459_c0_g4_i2::g.24561::m.24561